MVKTVKNILTKKIKGDMVYSSKEKEAVYQCLCVILGNVFYILDSSTRKDYNKKTNKRSDFNYSCNEESPMFGDTGLSNVRKYWRTPYVM